MTKGMNQRQRAFAEAYAIPGTDTFGNANKSAIAAGYSKKSAELTGSKLLRNAKVSNHIEGVGEQLFDERAMTGKEVLYHLTGTARAGTREIETVVAKTAEYIKHSGTKKHVLVYNENVKMLR